MTVPPASLLARLHEDGGLDALRTGRMSDGPVRHQTMHSALSWSYELLEPRARELLSALSVFPGSFTTTGAAELVDDQAPPPGIPPEGHDVSDRLETLTEYHFVEPVHDGSVLGRLELPPLIRLFARDQLDSGGQPEQVRARWVGVVTRLAGRAADEFHQGNHRAAFALLEHEWTGISAAIPQLLAWGRPEDGLQLAIDSAPYLLYVGYDPSALTRLEGLIEQVRRAGRVDSPAVTRALLWSAVLTRLRPDAHLHAPWVQARLTEGVDRARAVGDGQALLLGLEFTTQ